MSATVGEKAIRESLEGRLPLLTEERLYTKFPSVLWSCTTLAAGTWTFLVGIALPAIGSKEVGLIAYSAGAIAGFVLVMLSAGLPTVRYGVEAIDSTKATFGVRGMIVPLVGLLIMCVGTSYIIASLTATGLVNLIQAASGANVATHGLLGVRIAGIGTLVLVWALACRGPKLFERLAEYIAPAVIVISAVALLIMFYRFGLSGVWNKEAPSGSVITPDRVKAFMLAFEWGAAMALTCGHSWVP
jgi:NCS1 family nucleobase:cation symporter-1